jgi:hypothetical protein
MRTLLVRIVFCVAMATTAWSADAGDSLMARVRSTTLSPGDLTIVALIEPDARNRTIDFMVTSDDFYRRSVSELAGARAPRVNAVTYHNLPAGAYHVAVTVVGTDGVRGRYDTGVQVF